MIYKMPNTLLCFVFLALAIQATFCQDVKTNSTAATSTASANYITLKKGLKSEYTVKNGDKLRLECEFDSNSEISTVYWIKNLEEIMEAKRGRVNIIRRNHSSIIIFRKIDLFDKGSYSCYAENKFGNASSETVVNVIDNQIDSGMNLYKMKNRKPMKDFDYLSQLTDDDSSDEMPILNPTVIENFDEKGFCEPYKGTICAGIIPANFSIYSTSSSQQEQIEERLKSILPLLANKNSLSKRCQTFALPSLCLFAFPLCDNKKSQPKQICRSDCEQLQQDICKEEYLNVKSVFDTKLDTIHHPSRQQQQQQLPTSNFILECNQLPPSSDSQSECLPIIAITMDKIAYEQSKKVESIAPKIDSNDEGEKKLANLLYIVVPSVCVPLVVLCIFLTFCYCRTSNKQEEDDCESTKSSTIQTNNKLRMSNASIKAQKNPKFAHGGKNSSKSSMGSSLHNTNQAQMNANPELNPFLQKQIVYNQNELIFANNFAPNTMQHAHQMHQQYAIFQAQQQQSGDYAMVKQYAANNIRLLQDVGKGRFGKVFIGELIGSVAPNSVHKVIVKTLNELDFQNGSMEQEFYAEMNLYANLKHRNLSNLIGVHSHHNYESASMFSEQSDLSFPKCLIMEYLNNGDLHEYLLQRGAAFTNMSISSAGTGLNIHNRNITDFIYIALQIADGMEYLASQNFVHKDLATRNILMGDNLSIKISDFGQYRDAYSKDYYKFQNKVLPVRWMSPESLLFGRYAQDTDVWSFGVLLWEIFNYGVCPYSGCTNPEVVQMIRDRQLLMMPDECPQKIYQLMIECWHEHSVQRPTFGDIVNKLKSFDNYYVPQSHMNNIPQVNANQPVTYTMTNSYSSNSQNSKASSTNNTGSTACFSSSSPVSGSMAPPPPLPQSIINNYSPNKNFTTTSIFNTNKFKRNPSPPSSTITSTSSTRIYRELDVANSARNSLRQPFANTCVTSNGMKTNTLLTTATDNKNSNNNLIPNL